MIQTASHASSAPALRLTLTVKKRSRQTLAFKAVKTLAPAFAVLHTVMDGEAVIVRVDGARLVVRPIS